MWGAAATPRAFRRGLVAIVAALAVTVGSGAALAAPGMYVGAASDWPKQADYALSKSQFDLAASAGMNAIRITALWSPGMSSLTPELLVQYQTTARAAEESGVRVIVSVYPRVNREVPLTDEARAEFAAFTTGLAVQAPYFKDFIIGNEPNLRTFWFQQYNRKGKSSAPKQYVKLLAVTYDALKAVDPSINVIGGSVSPRGTDKPFGKRPSHSPGKFILGMGKAYRALKRDLPIMDQLAFHPYGVKSKAPPSAKHPRTSTITLNDYDKLIKLLRKAFKGTAQPGGKRLPIVYDEYGVQSRIPAEKDALYTEHTSPAAADAVSERKQARYYLEALDIAAKQPSVVGFLFFHTVDETDLRRWQSGLFYPDFTPKSSMAAVAEKIRSFTAPPVAAPVPPPSP